MGCLYRIAFPSGKAYVGITASTAAARFSEHCYNASTGRADRAVNRALRKYGKESTKLETLVVADWDYLVELERKAIAAFGTFGRGGYNMTAGGEGALGYKHTPESLTKMGATHKGNQYRLGAVLTPETREKISAGNKGKVMSPEVRAKIGAASKGNTHASGYKQSDELKARRSVNMRGKPHAGCGTSGHVGVHFYKQTGRFKAHLTDHGKCVHLGYHATLEEAIAARKEGERKYYER